MKVVTQDDADSFAGVAASPVGTENTKTILENADTPITVKGANAADIATFQILDKPEKRVVFAVTLSRRLEKRPALFFRGRKIDEVLISRSVSAISGDSSTASMSSSSTVQS